MHMRIMLVVWIGVIASASAVEPALEWTYETTGKIYTSPLIADLDGDGHAEVIVAASRDRKLLCLDGEGQLRWSVAIEDRNDDGLQATPSIADYDGDGKMEVFVVSKGGTVACIEHDGDIRWKVFLDDFVDYSAPALADIDADGHLDILIGSESGTLYCLDDTGARRWHYQGQGAIRGIPAVGRDPRGATLRVYATFSGGMLGCFDSEGNLVWKQDEPGPRGERRSGVAVGDLDGDGREEVVSATEDFTVIVADAATGEERWRWKGAHAIDQTCSFALADFDGSGRLDILCGDGLGLSQPGNVYRLREGQALWTADVGGGVLQGPSVGDVDGDGQLEVLVCSRSQRLICLGQDGTEEWSYAAGAGCLTTPALGDVDGDGDVDIVFTSKDRFIYCVSAGGAYNPEAIPWPNINKDLRLTGNADPPAFVARAVRTRNTEPDPLRFEGSVRDDLRTAEVRLTVTNNRPWPRRLVLDVESADVRGNKRVYTDTRRYEPYESRDVQLPMEVLYDGQLGLYIYLHDDGTDREIAFSCQHIDVNTTAAIDVLDTDMQRAFETIETRQAVADRAAPSYTHVRAALGASRTQLADTAGAKPRERRAAIAEAELAAGEAHRWLARARAQTATASNDMAVLADTSMRKIFRDEPFRGGISDVRVELARNESEAAQIVVIPQWRDLANLRATCNDLKHETVHAAIPVAVNPVGYIEIGTPEYSFPVEKIGAWPDILLPNTPLAVPADQDAQPYWLTVKTTSDTPPGLYRGVARVEADGCEPVDVPIEVEVWDFALPDETSLKTSFWFNENYVARFYGYEGRLPWDARKAWYDIHLAHRASPIKDFPLGGGEMVEDFDYLMTNGQNVFFVPVPHVSGQSKWPGIAERFEATHDLLESKGWNDDALLYSWDEVAVVGRHTIPEFVEINAWLKDAAPWWPRLETSAPEQALLGSVDIWCPTIDTFDPLLLADRMARGERLWFYTVWGRPGIMIEFPATDHRLMFWECWKYGAEGFLYWGTTHWDLNLQTEARWPEIPWIPWNRQPGHNGCGYLLYPGPDGRPLSSMRFELVRDGIEDYEYLHLLKTLVDRAGQALPHDLRDRAARELAMDPDVVKDNKTFTEDPKTLLDARDRIGHAIVEIQEWLSRQ